MSINSATCPVIPLTALRGTSLRAFLRHLLANSATPIPAWKLYEEVLGHFGARVCATTAACNDKGHETKPEYFHQVRLALQDGKEAGEFSTAEKKGHWSIVR